MTNKEEKFWEAVRASEKDWQAASDLLTVLWTKDMSPETYSAFLTAFRHMATLQEEMTLKLSKTWKGSRHSYAAAFLLEAAKAFDVLKEIGRLSLLRTDLSVPEEILALVELSGGAATEWQKILRYMEDTEGNRLKMEARLHRIASYQERGEKESFALLRFLYSGEDAVALIYWKDAVTALSRFLSAVNRKAELLQKLIEEA